MFSPVELVSPVLQEKLELSQVLIWTNSPASRVSSDLHQLLLSEKFSQSLPYFLRSSSASRISSQPSDLHQLLLTAELPQLAH